jgi:hypothetical protein
MATGGHDGDPAKPLREIVVIATPMTVELDERVGAELEEP